MKIRVDGCCEENFITRVINCMLSRLLLVMSKEGWGTGENIILDENCSLGFLKKWTCGKFKLRIP
jgi:hypothetical protein